MFYGQDRNQLRRFYCQAWRKYSSGEPLEPLETQVAQIIKEHPEYHPLLADEGKALAKDYPPELGETNPFLHMGLHLAIREQVSTDRPTGIRVVFEQIASREGTAHAAEHRIMDCLAETLWAAQRNNAPPDELAYLHCLQALVHQRDKNVNIL